jgi:hypothetical protein
LKTGGDGPGIIWNHQAELQYGVVTVTGAVTGSPDGDKTFQTERRVIKNGKAESVQVEAGETWELNLKTMTWTHQAELETPRERRLRRRREGKEA